jgi:hypothetical protein
MWRTARSVTVSAMAPLSIAEHEPGSFSLVMDAGDTAADAAIVGTGHEPNGYFWAGMAQWLARSAGSVPYDFDCEAGMFCAYGSDGAALQHLGDQMAEVVNSPERIVDLIRRAEEAGFEFDD